MTGTFKSVTYFCYYSLFDFKHFSYENFQISNIDCNCLLFLTQMLEGGELILVDNLQRLFLNAVYFVANRSTKEALYLK